MGGYKLMLHIPTGANNFGRVAMSHQIRPSAAFGAITTPAVGSKGAWVQLGIDTTDDTYGILLNVNSASGSASSRTYALDLGVDEAGGTSYTVRIPDLLVGGASTYAVGGSGVWYYFPLFVPIGSAIAVRAQGATTTTFRTNAQFMQRPSNRAMIRKGSFVESIGAVVPEGTAFTPGTTAEGAWTLLGTTAKRCWWWQLGVQVALADTAWNAGVMHVDLAVGDGTNYDVIIQDMPITFTTAEAMTNIPITAGVEWDVPAGSSIYVRGQHSGTLDTYTAVAYGLGG